MTGLGGTAQLGRDQFLKLLVTQVQNQNPLDPIKDEAFVAQLAQFSTLEGVEKLNANFSEMLILQQLTQGTNLLGRVAVFQRPGGSELDRGIVDGVVMHEGKLSLLVAGAQIPLDHLKGLAAK